MGNNNVKFCLRPDSVISRIFWIFLGFELLIVFLDIFVNHYEWSSISSIRRMVNITREDSLSNWFSSIQLIIVGVIAWIIAITIKRKTEIKQNAKKYYCWVGIALFFIYMGIDDAIKFHERIGTAFKTIITQSELSSGSPGVLSNIFHKYPSYSWQFVFGPIFFAIAVFILWFIFHELSLRKQKYLFLVAIELYVLAVGMDFVEGLEINPYFEAVADFFSSSVERVTHMSKAIEEFLEMFGTTIILTVFLRKLFSLFHTMEIKIRTEP